MDVINLKARHRTGKGKTYIHKIRKQGWIPAVYYGHSRETKNIEIDARQFGVLVRGKKTTHLINLELPGEKGEGTSVIKEIQRNVIKDDLFYNVDFQHVVMDEKISVNIPVHIIGTALGVKEEGGILNHPKRTILVECFPADIPEYIEVDVSELNIGDSIHVSELSVSKAEIKDSPEDVVAVVAPPAVEEEIPTVPEEGEEEAEAEGEAEAKEEAEGKEGEVEGKEDEEKKVDKKQKDEKSGDSEKK